MIFYLLFAASILCTVTAHFFLKKGILRLGEIKLSFPELFSSIWQAAQNGWIVGGGILFIMGFLLWLYILSKMQLNIAYPIIIGAQIILMALVSWVFLHEYLAWPQILGIVLVIAGIILISCGK